jgi:hypothetical protein
MFSHGCSKTPVCERFIKIKREVSVRKSNQKEKDHKLFIFIVKRIVLPNIGGTDSVVMT